MASVGPMSAGFKQGGGFFVPLTDLTGGGNATNCRILSYVPGSGAGGSYLPGSFSNALWATAGNSAASPHTSTISAIAKAGVLRDMGKTVVSASRTFRKVQLLTSSVSTAGVAGQAGTNPDVDYLTGYIELSSGNNVSATAAPVAYYPRLM